MPDPQARPAPPPSRSRRARAGVAARRAQVARLMLAGYTQRELARALRISQPTISADLRALRVEWCLHASNGLAELVAEERRVIAATEAVWQRLLIPALDKDLDIAVQVADRLAELVRRREALAGLLARAAPRADRDTP
jgi:DNA-binding CsgD family transcriptional regulator